MQVTFKHVSGGWTVFEDGIQLPFVLTNTKNELIYEWAFFRIEKNRNQGASDKLELSTEDILDVIFNNIKKNN